MTQTVEQPFVEVDSGTLMLIDPCYVIRGDDWKRLCDEELLAADTEGGAIPHKGGIIFGGFGGDGRWTPTFKRNKDGLVTSMTIQFYEDEDDA